MKSLLSLFALCLTLAVVGCAKEEPAPAPAGGETPAPAEGTTPPAEGTTPPAEGATPPAQP
jgi:hypothetical protein